jgi:hypothetical protein
LHWSLRGELASGRLTVRDSLDLPCRFQQRRALKMPANYTTFGAHGILSRFDGSLGRKRAPECARFRSMICLGIYFLTVVNAEQEFLAQPLKRGQRFDKLLAIPPNDAAPRPCFLPLRLSPARED